MYKKIALVFALLCTMAHYASDIRPWLEIKPSYFFFSASPMNDIYDHGGFEIQGSISVPLCTNLDLYGSIGYREAWGHALNTCEKTSLTIIPVDIGLKPVFQLCENVYYFFAIGPRYFYLDQHNKSPYVDCRISNSGIGFFLNTGFSLALREYFLIGIFGEYSYEKKYITGDSLNVYSNGSIQMGGFAFGISFGYLF